MTKIVRDALRQFRNENGLNLDEDSRVVWMAQLGYFVLPLPNFKWRRDVINLHDAHHLLTDYSVSASGELALATWELGARCFSDWRAKGLCLSLAFLGFFCQPTLTRQAYHRGRQQAASYAQMRKLGLLSLSLSDAQTLLGNN